MLQYKNVQLNLDMIILLYELLFVILNNVLNVKFIIMINFLYK